MNKMELMSALQISPYESKMFMPNEIFNDLSSCEDLGGRSSHVAFAYSYYYLVSWLYRFAKYIEYEKYDASTIKQILGYSRNNKTLNYIIKKGGVLDTLGYTRSVTDPPMYYKYEESMDIDFTLLSDIRALGQDIKSVDVNLRNTKIKMPVKGLFREEWAEKENYYNGTFNEVENTHMIPIEVFIKCMSNPDLGCESFYLYAFLSYKYDKFSSGINLSLEQITSQTGIKKSVRDKYINSLKEYNMIRCYPTNFVVGMPIEHRKSSQYLINSHTQFTDQKIKVFRRKIQHWEDVKQDYINNETINAHEIDKMLPF